MTEPSDRVPYKQGGISLALGKRFQVELPAAVFRARLTGLLFDTNKSFLLPSAIHGMRALKRLFDEHKNLTLLVTGHTDRAGADDYNLTLSTERAQSMSAYLRDAVEEWTKFYGKNIAEQKRWGAREDSLMIGQVVPADRLADPGDPPPATTGNVSAFQKFSNETRGTSLPTDGKITQDTRRELVAAYMAQPDTTLPKGVVPETHGCGPFHNEVPTGPGVAEQRNRRAEIFFFEGPVKPPPRKTCPAPKGCPEYPEWLKRTTKTIDLDRGVGTLTVQVQDSQGNPVEDAAVHLQGPFSEDGKTDAKGTASFPDLPAGSYTVAAAHERFEDGETSAVLGDGSQVTAKLSLKSKLFDFDVLVENEAKEPIADAQVEIDAPGVAAAKTNKDGIARLTQVPGGKFKLTATHPAFKKGSVETPVPPAQAKGPSGGTDTAAAGGGDQPVPVQLQSAPATLVVKVVDGNAKPPALPEPIGGATVRVLPPGNGAEQTKKTIDKSDKAHGGEATFDNLAPGTATVRVEADGFKSGQAQPVLTGGSKTSIEVVLQAATGTVVVTVTDDLGANVDDKDVLVTLQPPGSAKALTAPTTQGKAKIENVPPGKCKIVAAKPGFADGETTADVLADQTVEKPVQLKRQLGELTVTVVTPSGELLQDAAVTLEKGTDKREAKTEKSGDTPPFKDVPAGKWKVSARLDNFTSPAAEEIEVKAAAGQKKTITLTPANVTAKIDAVAPATLPLVVVKKKGPCTPARKQITLSVQGTFTGSGTGRFTRSRDTIKFFTAASAGTELKFDGKDNVFTAADLTAGKQLFAEGATASGAKEDTELKLELLAGGNSFGTPAAAKATCIELTVDLFQSRTARAGDPAKMSDAGKTGVGRFVHVQDTSFNQGRAILVVREVQPAGFAGAVKLQRKGAGGGAIQLFSTEDHKTGESATALPATLTAAQLGGQTVAGAKGFPLFVEGKTKSGGLADIVLQLGIDGDEADGDRVAFTVVQFTNLQAVVPSTRSPRTGAIADHPAFVISGASPNHFSEDLALNPPLVLMQNSVENTAPVRLSVTIEPPAAAAKISWSALRDTRPAPDGDSNDVVAASPNATPKIAGTGATATLLSDAVGTFRIRAFINGNSSADFDRDPATADSFAPDPFILLNLALVHARLDHDDVQNHQTLAGVAQGGGGIRASSGVFDVVNQPNNTALHHNALCTIIGGGRNGRIGTDRVFAGWMQDAVAAIGHRGTYVDNTVAPPVVHPVPIVQENPRRGTSPASTTPFILAGQPAPAIFPTPPPILDSGRVAAGTGGVNACLGQSRITSRNNAATGEQLRVEAVDSPAVSFRAVHPGFPNAALTFFHFEMRFRAVLAFWTNNHSPPNPGSSNDPAERLYVVALDVPWSMVGEWDINPGTGAVSIHGAAPAVSMPGNTKHTPAVSAQSLNMEPTVATGQTTWLGTWIHDART